MFVVNLMAIYNNVKSYYNKAKVIIETEGDKVTNVKLISYDTEVAVINNGVLYIKGTYSATTLKHITDFIYQYRDIISDFKKYFIHPNIENMLQIDKKHILKYMDEFEKSEELKNKFYGKV